MRILVNIDVDDLEKGVAFYRDALGFSFRRFLFDGSVAELAAASVRVMLLLKAAGSVAVKGSRERRSYARHWTPLHLDIEVDDIGIARERAVAAGARAEGEVAFAAWGKLLQMSDPFGHGFCLVEFSDRGYDVAERR
jgi:predicted enzyme related to lactoylglutathione lyase